MYIALAALSVDVIFTAAAAVISISSLEPVPEAVISIPPFSDDKTIESETFSVDLSLTEEPVASITISSPAAAASASI